MEGYLEVLQPPDGVGDVADAVVVQTEMCQHVVGREVGETAQFPLLKPQLSELPNFCLTRRRKRKKKIFHEREREEERE